MNHTKEQREQISRFVQENGMSKKYNQEQRQKFVDAIKAGALHPVVEKRPRDGSWELGFALPKGLKFHQLLLLPYEGSFYEGDFVIPRIALDYYNFVGAVSKRIQRAWSTSHGVIPNLRKDMVTGRYYGATRGDQVAKMELSCTIHELPLIGTWLVEELESRAAGNPKFSVPLPVPTTEPAGYMWTVAGSDACHFYQSLRNQRPLSRASAPAMA